MTRELTEERLQRLEVAAWRLACQQGRIAPHEALQKPRCLVLGEAPGPNTDPRIPLYPHTRTCAAGRLMEWAGLSFAQWLSLTVRRNLCEREWNEAEAQDSTWRMLDMCDARKISRIVLLGKRVTRAWMGEQYDAKPFGADIFGLTTVYWIPHPSGLNRVYNSYSSREHAGEIIRKAVCL